MWGQQGQHFTVEYQLPMGQNNLEHAQLNWEIPLPDHFTGDFMAFSAVFDGSGVGAQTLEPWLDRGMGWEPLPPFGEEVVADRFVSELVFVARPATLRIRLKVSPLAKIQRGKIRLFSPGGDLGDNLPLEGAGANQTCPCPIPSVVPRSNWGAAWNLSGDIYIPPAVYTKVSHLIVHHSAGTNTSNNWRGVVAAIFDYHVNTNGWSDVGYNWLIDPNGVLYEGRGGGNNVRGAHMCGYNNNTMGVCLLGNFVSADPSPQAMGTLKQLLAWKCCDTDINPLGNEPILSHTGAMKNISGHLDGCAPGYTECPGGRLYPLLGALRTSVSDHLQNVCNSTGTHGEAERVFPNLLISPNPAQNEVHIHCTGQTSAGWLRVRDVMGNTLCAKRVEVGQTDWDIDVRHFASGIYFIAIQASDGAFFQKKAIIARN